MQKKKSFPGVMRYCSHCLLLYSPVCVGHGQKKPEDSWSHDQANLLLITKYSTYKQVAQRATIANLRPNFTFSYCKSMGDDDPRGLANLDPRGMIGRIYVGTTNNGYTQNIKALDLMVSEEDFFTFSYCKSAGNDDPLGVANLDPRIGA